MLFWQKHIFVYVCICTGMCLHPWKRNPYNASTSAVVLKIFCLFFFVFVTLEWLLDSSVTGVLWERLLCCVGLATFNHLHKLLSICSTFLYDTYVLANWWMCFLAASVLLIWSIFFLNVTYLLSMQWRCCTYFVY